MSESARSDEPSIACTDDRCAGVRKCASDLAARGVRVCGCVYPAHHHTVRSPPPERPRCAGTETRTPNTGEPEHFAAVAYRHMPRLKEQP